MGRQHTVIFMVGTFGIIVANKIFVTKSFPKPRVFIGLAIAFAMIGFLAEFAPDLATAFALLVFVGILLSEGVTVFNGISKSLGGK